MKVFIILCLSSLYLPTYLLMPQSMLTGSGSKDYSVVEVASCIFAEREMKLPRIRDAIGDTIGVKNTYDWVRSLQTNAKDNAIGNLLNRGNKFFQINEHEKFITVGFLEDEGAYIGVYAYSMEKETCEILGNELLAETSAWEHGFKETYSIFESDFSLRKEKKVGAKDWGDYTKWAIDTVITNITFDERGKMLLDNE